MTTTMTRLSRQWMSRPDDERFPNLHALAAFTAWQKQNSKQGVYANRDLKCIVDPEDKGTDADPVPRGIFLKGPQGSAAAPTHHAVNQLCQFAKAPAKYLRSLPAPLVADCVNWGLQVLRPVEELGVLIHRDQNGGVQLRSVNGPDYGRVWNADLSSELVDVFGDGTTGRFRVPGPFNSKLATVTKADSTLFAGETDMFVFLSDDENRIEMPNRRGGEKGALSRGVLVGNSEVGAGSLWVAFFLYDYMCSNRIIWGVQEFSEIRMRHTSGVHHRFAETMLPAIKAYADSKSGPVAETIAAAQLKVLGDKVDEFLRNRFGERAEQIQAVHLAEEGRPINTLWDAVTGATAFARSIGVQNERVKVEREAGKILQMAA